MRSATPQLSRNVAGETGLAVQNNRAKAIISIKPRRITAALVLSPKFRPSQKPAPTATMFYNKHTSIKHNLFSTSTRLNASGTAVERMDECLPLTLHRSPQHQPPPPPSHGSFVFASVPSAAARELCFYTLKTRLLLFILKIVADYIYYSYSYSNLGPLSFSIITITQGISATTLGLGSILNTYLD